MLDFVADLLEPLFSAGLWLAGFWVLLLPFIVLFKLFSGSDD